MAVRSTVPQKSRMVTVKDGQSCDVVTVIPAASLTSTPILIVKTAGKVTKLG